jgi:hypothetical protein
MQENRITAGSPVRRENWSTRQSCYKQGILYMLGVIVLLLEQLVLLWLKPLVFSDC